MFGLGESVNEKRKKEINATDGLAVRRRTPNTEAEALEKCALAKRLDWRLDIVFLQP
jgi:hypothetical protein